MGLCPPQSFQEVWNAALTCDINGDGRINKLEMFMLFKKLQEINAGMTMNTGGNMGGIGGNMRGNMGGMGGNMGGNMGGMGGGYGRNF